MVTGQFVPVSSESIELQSIVATGDEASDNVCIETLDAYGRMAESYSWNDWAYESACWVDDGYEKVEGVTFAPGTGLWVQGAGSTQGIQTAGKVGSSDVTIDLRAGFTAVGNPYPVSVNLQDIIALGDETSDNVCIETLDAYGRMVESYSWNDWAAEEPCWVNDSYEKVEGVTFAPGDGLWVQGSSSGQSLRFPAPEL